MPFMHVVIIQCMKGSICSTAFKLQWTNQGKLRFQYLTQGYFDKPLTFRLANNPLQLGSYHYGHRHIISWIYCDPAVDLYAFSEIHPQLH